MDKYLTLGKKAEIEIVINRSRFIGRAMPTDSEEEALAYLDKLRTEFPDATHHCYAYVIGRGGNIRRFSDDGEPGGTAGMPILQVILQRNLENALVVVTRYYGGVKLGAGGLVRAYSTATSEVLNRAKVKEMSLSHKGIVSLDYDIWGTLEYTLRQKGIPILNTKYKEKVETEVIIPMDWETFSGMVVELTNGRAQCIYLEETYYSWPKDNRKEGG